MKVVQGKGIRSQKKRDRSSRRKCYVPKGPRDWWTAGMKEEEEEVVSFQERLEVVAVSVKATTLATRNKSKSKVPQQIRKYGGGGGERQESCVEKCALEKARKASR